MLHDGGKISNNYAAKLLQQRPPCFLQSLVVQKANKTSFIYEAIRVNLGESKVYNKTKYFCSDSMMKYALREGFERAKREIRES